MFIHARWSAGHLNFFNRSSDRSAVVKFWPKFRYRSGKNIADEMIFHYEMTGVNKFYFTDSLINGSMKAFRDMCDKLADYNQTHSAGFSWGGQFIWRPERLDPPENFEMMRLAGADTFYVGVETGSDKILCHVS